MPLARVVVEKKRGRKKAASEKRLTVDMMSLQRLRERMIERGVAAKTCTLGGVETWWGLKGIYTTSSDGRKDSGVAQGLMDVLCTV